MRFRGARTRLGAGVVVGVVSAAAVLGVLSGASSAARSTTRGSAPAPRRFVPGQVIVGFRAGVPAPERADILDRAGATTPDKLRGLNAVVARTGHVARSIAQLERDPSVRYAEPNYILTADGVAPNDPSFGKQWGLDNVGQIAGFLPGVPGADIHAEDAWQVTTGSPDVTVAVLDSGLDLSHPDLAANVWVNPGENCAGCRTDGVDNDQNGYVDDWRGWDFHDNDNDPSDDNGHGTHVSGTIGAVGNNGQGVSGVDWTVRLMPLRFIGADGTGTTEDAVRAIEYAVQNGAHVLNNSYGATDSSQALSDAIGTAEAHDALFVASAGNSSADNDAAPTYPASDPHPNVVSVAATTNRDQRAWFSNYGRTTVDLGAPGDYIYSTWPGGGYAYESGTSMAAPHVAGAAALAESAFPAASALGLKALLLRTVDPNSYLAGRTTTGGRLNVDAAVHCTGAQAWIETPASGFVTAVGEQLQLSAIGARCGDPAGAAVSASVNGEPIALTAQGNGLYTATYTVTAAGLLQLTVTATSPGGSDSATVFGQVPTPIVPGGPPVTVSVGSPGDTALLAFAGTAGQRVSLRLSDVTMGSTMVRLLAPDGASVGSTVYVGSYGGFADVRTLPATGTYTLVVDPSGTTTGSMTLTLYDVPPDASATAVPDGPPVTVETTVPGQNAGVRFDGVAGGRVSVTLTGVTMSSASVKLLAPDGSSVGSTTYVGTSGAFMDVRALPVSGTYTLAVDPQQLATGSMTLTLYDVPPDPSVPIVPGGPPVTLTTTAPGQNAAAQFSGTAGQRVSLSLTGVTMSSASVKLLAPDGSSVGSTTYVGTYGGFVDVRTLPDSGTYTLAVDPQQLATGSMTLTLYDVPPDPSSSIVKGGPAVTVTTTAPGQNASLSFDGTAGQSLTLQVSGVTIPTSLVSVLAPDGSYVVRRTYVYASGRTFKFTLPATGQYTIAVDPQGTNVGSMTLRLT